MPQFIPGLALGALFYQEVVRPILDREFPGLPHSAALIGAGSEILGFDTAMSTDHDWGPRVMLFLREEEHERYQTAIQQAMGRGLPREFRGYSTDFGASAAAGEADREVAHRVQTFTPRGFFLDYLGFDLRRDIGPADWLTFPEQKLLSITAGAVYHDGIGLQTVRERFAYYPHDVWLYLLAAGWNRIGQEEHLMGRAGLAGDEIGSAIIGSRLARDLMWLCFLMEQQYAPYPKWFGTAFSRLACAPQLKPALRQAQLAPTWQERERHLGAAYAVVAALHNALGITAPLPTTVTPFFNRPFQVIHLNAQFADALRARITDPAVVRIAGRRLIGSLDQWSDSTDILAPAEWRAALRRLYEVDAGTEQ